MDQIVLEWKVNGTKQSKTIDSNQTINIGRHPACDLVLGDPYVSRRHAAIFFKKNSFHLHNMSSTNPIVFNDRWTLSHDLKADLEPGDSFVIGRIRIKVSLPVDLPAGNRPSTDELLQVYCPSCFKLFDRVQETCPWCGAEQAEIDTVELEKRRAARPV